MTRPYSIAFKQKMINRLTGRDAVSAHQLAKDTGIRQQNLSRWLREARNLPLMESNNQVVFTWTVEQKARLLADASKLTGEALTAHLECEGVTFAEFEQWRLALEEGGRYSRLLTSRFLRREGIFRKTLFRVPGSVPLKATILAMWSSLTFNKRDVLGKDLVPVFPKLSAPTNMIC